MNAAGDDARGGLLRGKLLNELELARKTQGLTQAELAQRIGVNRMTVARAEAEDADPLLSTFLAMALALGREVRVAGDATVAPLPRDLVHRGLSHNRTQHHTDWRDRQREKALAQSWEAVNRDEGVGLSPILASLVPGCTQEQATACATVIQWLGSDVGFDFLQRALDRAGYSLIDKKETRK